MYKYHTQSTYAFAEALFMGLFKEIDCSSLFERNGRMSVKVRNLGEPTTDGRHRPRRSDNKFALEMQYKQSNEEDEYGRPLFHLRRCTMLEVDKVNHRVTIKRNAYEFSPLPELGKALREAAQYHLVRYRVIDQAPKLRRIRRRKRHAK